MTFGILAKQGEGDWIQIVVLLLVFGASAIKPVLNALIEKFKPKADKDHPAGAKQARPTVPNPRQSPSQLPQARPMPGAPVARRPAPPHPTVPTDQPATSPAELEPVIPVRPVAPRPRPFAKPATSSNRPTPPKTPATKPRRQPAKTATQQPLSPRKSAAPSDVSLGRSRRPQDDASAELVSSLDNGGVEIDDRVEEHLGHVEGSLKSATGVTPETTSHGDIGTETPASLRRAFALSEILAPPLALRKPTDSW